MIRRFKVEFTVEIDDENNEDFGPFDQEVEECVWTRVNIAKEAIVHNLSSNYRTVQIHIIDENIRLC